MSLSVTSRPVIIAFSVAAFAASFAAVYALTHDSHPNGTNKQQPVNQQSVNQQSVPAALVADRQRYAQQVNKLCGERSAAAAPPVTDPKQAAVAIKASFDNERKLLTQIGAVTPPAADRDRVTTEFVTPVRQRLDRADALLQKLTTAAAAGDQATAASVITQLVQVSTPTPTELTFARTFGVQGCFG